MKRKSQHMSFGKKGSRITITHLNKPMSMGLVGMVTSRLFPEKIALVIDETNHEECEYDFACLAHAAQKRHPRIMLWREVYYDFIRGSDEARTILFHELGHHVDGDCIEEGFSQDAYHTERIESARQGLVSDKELAADAFAMRYLGKGTVMHGLSSLLDKVRAMYSKEDYDENEVCLMIGELDNRISSIRSASE